VQRKPGDTREPADAALRSQSVGSGQAGGRIVPAWPSATNFAIASCVPAASSYQTKCPASGRISTPADHEKLERRLGAGHPLLAFPPEVRRVIYTTNAIEALNRQLRKAIKTKGQFPNQEAARKLIYLAITNATTAWTKTRSWTAALLAFKIHFGDRLPE
jgi:Transposase, Mutator family